MGLSQRGARVAAGGGTLDTSFSGDGTTNFPGLRPTAVAVQDDGKIVSVATSTNEPATIVVGRLTATGQVDTSLGGSTAAHCHPLSDLRLPAGRS